MKKIKKNIKIELIYSLLLNEITLDEYMIKYGIPLVDLIKFAKENDVNPKTLKEMYKYLKQYELMTKSFDMENFLSTYLVFYEGKKVKPTKEEVLKCIEFLKMSNLYVCEYNIKLYIRLYIQKEIDLNISLKENNKLKERNKKIQLMMKKINHC